MLQLVSWWSRALMRGAHESKHVTPRRPSLARSMVFSSAWRAAWGLLRNFSRPVPPSFFHPVMLVAAATRSGAT